MGKSFDSDNKSEKENFTFFNKREYWTRRHRNACSIQCAVSLQSSLISPGPWDVTQICMDIRHIQNNQKGG